MELLIVILLAVPIVAVISIFTLFYRTSAANERIESLTRRVQELELEIIRVKHPKPEAAPEAKPVTAPVVAKPQPVAPTAPPAPLVPPIIAPIPKPFAAPPIKPIEQPAVVPVAKEMPVSPAPPIFVGQAESAPPVAEPIRESAQPTPGKESFEMRLGTYWFVRIGIVIILTALVFLGQLAYHNFIGKLGPGGKLSLLYVASGLLLGLGAWWQRKAEKPSLRNYAQVLFAGGLAAVYFTTYAAHHLPQVRVIENPVLDGALLLGWAGFMAWIADRRKSEVLALFAVGLAYYTSIITTVGAFTLYSNIVLTVVAVTFLVRNRWAGLSFASLVATYFSYAFWRFFHDGQWHLATPDESLWFGAYFLMAYWALFTAAVFLSKHEKLAGQSRSAFLTLNNGAFFALFLLTMLQVHSGGFWKFSLIYGCALLILTEASRRLLPSEPLTKNSYLTQGLLLVTLGFISKFTGLKLALVLGVESVTLFILGTQLQSRVLKAGGYVAAALGVLWGIDSLEQFDTPGLWLGTALGALMIINSFWAHRQDAASETAFRGSPGYFALLGLAAWFATTYNNTTLDEFPLALGIEAVILTMSIYLLRVREVVVLGQFFLFAAQLVLIQRFLGSRPALPWWNSALLIAITLGLSHWWQHQKTLTTAKTFRRFWQGLYGLGVVGLLYFWLQPQTSAPDWLVVTSVLAIIITIYGVATRLWLLALFGQIFLLISATQFVAQLAQSKPDWHYPLAPIFALGALSFATMRWFAATPESAPDVRDPLLAVAKIYRWAALGMSLWWVGEYVPERERVWAFAALGLIVFALAGWRRNREALLFSAVYSAAGFILLWFRPHGEPLIYAPNLLAILALLAQQQIARRLSERFQVDQEIHKIVVVVGCGTLWWFMSRWVMQGGGGFYLTASWSGLALVLFAIGITLRERMYRWVGLGILAAALGRVVLFDVWKQETIYRVLTFLALGIVLLVLGFVYNKYQDTIRKWL